MNIAKGHVVLVVFVSRIFSYGVVFSDMALEKKSTSSFSYRSHR